MLILSGQHGLLITICVVHQIRVHLRSLGHPIVNDSIYNDAVRTAYFSPQCCVNDSSVRQLAAKVGPTTSAEYDSIHPRESQSFPSNALPWQRFRGVIFDTKSLLPQNPIQIRQRSRGMTWSRPSYPANQLTIDQALAVLEDPPLHIHNIPRHPNHTYCHECLLPIHPDPDPESLCVFLHALRYTMSLGSFETAMPQWAENGFVWKGMH